MRQAFLQACNNEPADHTPIWFMRQAGRSLPEYRALRERHPILELCRTPELAAEVTLQPVRRLGVDAAILFSDIVVPLQAMGISLDIRPGVGPVIEDPIRTSAGVKRMHTLVPQEGVPFVLETIEILTKELDVPLIGFAGAPFTLASYLVEGGPSRDQARTKALMHSDPTTWFALMDLLADSVLAYLRAQIEAGAAAVQLFDSWVGQLHADDYRTYVAPASTRILQGLAGLGIPRVHFGIGTGELLDQMSAAGADVVGIDWRVPLDEGRRRAGGKPVQGNLDPALCLSTWEAVRDAATTILERGGGTGHIFNLGHGVLPGTDPDMLKRLVDHVHGWHVDG